MMTENCHLSLREIAAELSVSNESIRTILKDCLDMKRVAARLPRRKSRTYAESYQRHCTAPVVNKEQCQY